jgi:uncharacterized membrane protein YdbT with pleckstrin-like domain
MIGFCTLIFKIIENCTTKFFITNKKVMGKIGFIYKKTMEAPLNKINNTNVNQSLFGKIFNYGTVVVNTSSGRFTYHGVNNPEKFRNILMKQIDEFDENRIKKQATEMAKVMNKN